MTKKTVLVVALLLGAVSLSSLHAAPAEIFLVRHAQKQQSTDKDPKLSPCGLAQAKAMAELIPTPLATIYHSGYQRTQQTAEHLALTQPQAVLQRYNAADLTAFAEHIQQQQSAVLIVGHSNTTPALIHLLSQLPAPKIAEQDYGTVYQLKQSAQGYQLVSLTIQQPTICNSSST